MESPAHSLENLFDRLEVYGKTTIEISKLKVIEASIKVTTKIISKLSVVVIISLSILIFSLALALYLGDLLGKSYYGFLIVAIAYLIGGIILHVFLNKWLRKPIADIIISEALN
jgi:hypothetical protein